MTQVIAALIAVAAATAAGLLSRAGHAGTWTTGRRRSVEELADPDSDYPDRPVNQ